MPKGGQPSRAGERQRGRQGEPQELGEGVGAFKEKSPPSRPAVGVGVAGWGWGGGWQTAEEAVTSLQQSERHYDAPEQKDSG